MPAWLQRIAIVIVAAAGLADCGGHATPTPEKTPQAAAANRLATPYPIEPFIAPDLNAATVSLASWKGNVVVINVWATWCAPCRRELPMLSSLQTRYRDRVRVLGLLQDNVTDAFARRFIASTAINFPIVRSTPEIERRLPAIAVIPMTFVLDKEGRLVAMFAGETDATQLEQEIETALSQKSEVRSQK